MAQKKRLRLKKKVRRNLTGITVFILIASFVAIMMLTPIFDISEITVRGNSVITAEEIIKSSGIVKGINIFGISLKQAERNIEEMGYVDEAKLRRIYPSKIEITVVEAVGVAYIPAESGYIVITADGRSVGTVNSEKKSENSESDEVKQLPVIKGMKNVKYKIGSKITSKNKTQLNLLFDILKEFSKNGYIFDMTTIDVTNISNVSFNYNKGLKVKLGECEKLDYKAEVFGSILAEIGEDAKGILDLERQTYRKNEQKIEEKQE